MPEYSSFYPNENIGFGNVSRDEITVPIFANYIDDFTLPYIHKIQCFRSDLQMSIQCKPDI